MRRTIETGFDVIREKEYDNISKMAQDLSKGMLLGARGNSGVILSQIFRGFSEGLQNKKFVSIIYRIKTHDVLYCMLADDSLPYPYCAPAHRSRERGNGKGAFIRRTITNIFR